MRLLSIMAALLAFAAPALTQSLPEKIIFDDVIDFAFQSNPRTELDWQDVAVARADRTSAGAWPNPTVTYGGAYQTGPLTNFEGHKAHEVGVEFPLLIGGQRRARIEAAEQGLRATEARVKAAATERAVEAGAAYIELLVAQEKLRLLEERQKEIVRLRKLVEGRRSSGMASDYDLERIEVEGAIWLSDVGEAKADLAGKRARLAAIFGVENWRPRGAGKLRPWRLSALSGYDDYIVEHPTVTAARRDVSHAQASLETARRERFPEVSVNTGRFWTESPYGSTTNIGVSLEIPIFDRREGAVEKAEAEVRTAYLKLRVANAEVHADLVKYASQVRERGAAFENFRANVNPRLAKLKRMSEDAYKLSGGTIADLLDATRTRVESTVSGVELTGSLMEAQLRFQAARGDIAALLTEP
ncbi:TolC family protein [Hyphomicrobium sulfonivorans]|uniref:TolC family protein n=1 Tax=Hyphomicrobium sulfonivorans TaxID=121290 RepID=UPI00156D6678|nr:TolC family protein [Hyphomicrobium sulfonivorans]MBI1649264.1 TolC family protein [Hyphomicrobium sulfonivorans]NSL70205.1 hypothetical protein [Hyphomicrobium sulfonivorans]